MTSHTLHRERTLYRVPRPDFVRLSLLIERASEAHDAATLETILDYLGRLAHVTGLSRRSKATVLALYAVSLESWASITQLGDTGQSMAS